VNLYLLPEMRRAQDSGPELNLTRLKPAPSPMVNRELADSQQASEEAISLRAADTDWDFALVDTDRVGIALAEVPAVWDLEVDLAVGFDSALGRRAPTPARKPYR